MIHFIVGIVAFYFWNKIVPFSSSFLDLSYIYLEVQNSYRFPGRSSDSLFCILSFCTFFKQQNVIIIFQKLHKIWFISFFFIFKWFELKNDLFIWNKQRSQRPIKPGDIADREIERDGHRTFQLFQIFGYQVCRKHWYWTVRDFCLKFFKFQF